MTTASLESLPAWQRRTIALGVLFCAKLVLIALLVWPAVAVVVGHREWRAESAETLARYQALAGSKSGIEAQLQQAQAHPLWSSLFTGTDAAVATNALQAEFRGLLDAQKIPVQVSAPLEPTAGARITRIGVRLNVELTVDQLQALLQRVREHHHRVVLDNVTIAAPQYQSPEQNPSLQVQMEVWGFMRTPPASEAT